MAVTDENNCNPLKAWQDMGSPKYLKKDRLEILHQASELVYEEVPLQQEQSQAVRFTAEPESVTILKVAIE